MQVPAPETHVRDGRFLSYDARHQKCRQIHSSTLGQALLESASGERDLPGFFGPIEGRFDQARIGTYVYYHGSPDMRQR